MKMVLVVFFVFKLNEHLCSVKMETKKRLIKKISRLPIKKVENIGFDRRKNNFSVTREYLIKLNIYLFPQPSFKVSNADASRIASGSSRFFVFKLNEHLCSVKMETKND